MCGAESARGALWQGALIGPLRHGMPMTVALLGALTASALIPIADAGAAYEHGSRGCDEHGRCCAGMR